MESENSYCRLCAQLKYSTKMLNLQSDENKRKEISKKLDLVNANTNLYKDCLPKTVCFECVNSLDRAFDFVTSIKHAQDVLHEIFVKNIKVESLEGADNDEYNMYDMPEDQKDFFSTMQVDNLDVDVKSNVKEELVEELDQPEPEIKTSKDTKSGFLKKHEDLSIDALPLSQLKLTWKDYSWTCSFCGSKFPTIEELKIHSMHYHNSCNVYRCTDCNMSQIDLKEFVIHVKTHLQYLKFSCHLCHKRFSTTYQLSEHSTEHEVAHYCKGCFTLFPSDEELSNHMDKYYKSKICTAQSSQMNELNQQTNAEGATCSLCKETFMSHPHSQAHLLIHTLGKRDYTCEKCGKCSLNKRNLARHMVAHHNERPYQCEICKITFKARSHLQLHVRVHDKKKPFACEQKKWSLFST